MIWINTYCVSLLRSQVLPAGQTGELHPAADPSEPLLWLPGEVRLQSRRPASHRGRRSHHEAAGDFNLGPTAVSPAAACLYFLSFSANSGLFLYSVSLLEYLYMISS